VAHTTDEQPLQYMIGGARHKVARVHMPPPWLCSWLLRAIVAAVVLVVPVGSVGDGRRLGAAYSVSQTHSLNVRADGQVDIVLSIVFNVAAGSVLPGSSKTILSDFGIQSIVGPVAATDASGRSLPVRTSSDRSGWLKVAFDFAQPVNGSVTPHHLVKLAYTVSNGICAPSSGLARFGLSWAHRWIVPVLHSRYEVSFANTQMDMSSVCIGASGFRPRCGPSDLTVVGTKAFHKGSGALHNAFFEWAAADVSARQCDASSSGGGSDAPTLAPLPEGLAAEAIPEEGEPMAAMSLGLVALGSSILVGGAVCAYGHKARKSRQRERARQAEETGVPGKKQLSELMELDVEEGASDSTVATITESPRFTSHRPLSPIAESPGLGSRGSTAPLTPDRLRQTSQRQQASPAGNMNWFLKGSPPRGSPPRGSPPAGNRIDTGAGLGAWDVPDEFHEEELSELASLSQNSSPDHVVQISEDRPSSHGIDAATYGKTSSFSARMGEMVSKKLHGVGKSKASDPFAVDAACEDTPLEDDLVHPSDVTHYFPSSPTMALTHDGIGISLHEHSRHDGRRAPAPSPEFSSWAVLDEFNAEDATHRAVLVKPQPCTMLSLEADASSEDNLELPSVLGWAPGGRQADAAQWSLQPTALPPLPILHPTSPAVAGLMHDDPLSLMLSGRKTGWEADGDEEERPEIPASSRFEL